jgi:hypothetical protein
MHARENPGVYPWRSRKGIERRERKVKIFFVHTETSQKYVNFFFCCILARKEIMDFENYYTYGLATRNGSHGLRLKVLQGWM